MPNVLDGATVEGASLRGIPEQTGKFLYLFVSFDSGLGLGDTEVYFCLKRIYLRSD